MCHRKPIRRPPQSCRGLSLIEVSVSTMLVGMVLVGAMQSLGSIAGSRTSMSNQARAIHLAEHLMTEILNQEYRDPEGSLVGLEIDEVLTTRSLYDDVDDYDAWNSTRPEDADGNALPNTEDWRRSVNVVFVEPDDPATISSTDQGVKRITVTVRLGARIMARAVALRSNKYKVP